MLGTEGVDGVVGVVSLGTEGVDGAGGDEEPGTDGVDVAVGEEASGTEGVDGEAGEAGAGAGLETALQLLIEEVWILQMLGRLTAWVWLMMAPSCWAAAPLKIVQRHWAWDCTRLASWEQHKVDGVDEFPVTKPRQGERLAIASVQLD